MKRIVTIQYNPNQGPQGPQGPPGPGAELPITASDVIYEGDGRTVEEVLAELLFLDLAILSFTTPQVVFENGQSLSSLVFTWGLNKTIASQSISGTNVVSPTLVAADRSKTVSFSPNLTSAGTITLSCNDGSGYPGAIQTANINISFLKGVYMGVAPSGTVDSAFVLGLNKTLQSNYVRSGNLNVTAGQYIWFAIPVSYGTPTFKIGGFVGGMEPASTISFTNIYGSTENYYVFRSTNSNLGTVLFEAI